MELEQIQDLLNDAMEMAQAEDDLPPHINAEDIDAVSSILADWIIQLQQDDEKVDLVGTRQIVVSAIACAYLAGQLANTQVTDYANQTHRSESGNTYHIYNYFG